MKVHEKDILSASIMVVLERAIDSRVVLSSLDVSRSYHGKQSHALLRVAKNRSSWFRYRF